MALAYNLIKFGSVWATDDGLVGGVRYISDITGLEAYQVTDAIQTIRALDNTIYSQYQAIKDVPISIIFPLIDTAKFDAIRDEIQTAITGLTTLTLDITGDAGTFTFTAKPQTNPIKFSITNLSGKLANVNFSFYVTD